MGWATAFIAIIKENKNMLVSLFMVICFINLANKKSKKSDWIGRKIVIEGLMD
jgi:hypothetical protein